MATANTDWAAVRNSSPRWLPWMGRPVTRWADTANAIGSVPTRSVHWLTFDVVVVGGGITGAGVALDAAARGLRVALVEKGDFASGTSSKSSKLVHGGLRYLQQREIRLVYEALAERQRLLCNAPHLVRVLPFLIPLLGKDGTVNRTIARAMSTALWMYDATGGARIGKLHERISVDESRAHMPTLRADRLVAGFLYYDAQTDDARLTLTILRTAVLDHDVEGLVGEAGEGARAVEGGYRGVPNSAYDVRNPSRSSRPMVPRLRPRSSTPAPRTR